MHDTSGKYWDHSAYISSASAVLLSSNIELFTKTGSTVSISVNTKKMLLYWFIWLMHIKVSTENTVIQVSLVKKLKAKFFFVDFFFSDTYIFVNNNNILVQEIFKNIKF
jgi:hypothetical protein